MISIQQQIDWLEAQLRHMKRSLPESVAAGRIDQANADQKFESASGVMTTLINVRSLTRGDDGRLLAPFIGEEQIKRMALCSFMLGETMQHCPLPWHSKAYNTWHDEFVRLQAEKDAQKPSVP